MRRRGRLVRRYFLISTVLIASGLVMSGLVEIYFRYGENRENIDRLQAEVTAGAAFKIEQFIDRIHDAMEAASKSRELTPTGLTAEYRFELEKLLVIVPAVTEAVALDAHGTIRILVARLRSSRAEGETALSASAAFRQTKGGRPYFGPVYFVRDSEPYMTIAVPIRPFAGNVIGALLAEVSLQHIGEVISSIKVGHAGYAYLVSRSGDLIAHPDIDLVLRRHNMGQLDQVKRAVRPPAAPALAATDVARSVQGVPVISASVFIPSLDWAVVTERPVKEAYQALYPSLIRTAGLLLVGLGVAMCASVFLARRVVYPLQVLGRGVERIASGDLAHRLELRTGDEIEALADEFNTMTARLEESYAHLEHKVEERTRELAEALEQQTATADILRVMATSPTEIQPILDAVVEHAARLCQAHGSAIYAVSGSDLRPAATYGTQTSPPPAIAISRVWPLGRAIVDRETVHVHADDGGEDGGAGTLLVTPLLRDGTPLGAILIRRASVRPFSDKHVALLKTFADQTVIAIENVRYLRDVAHVTAAAATVENGAFEAESLTDVAGRSDELGRLARVFQRMALEIQAREKQLRKQIQELRIEIDEVKKARQVAEITETSYFSQLQEKARQFRQRGGASA